MPIIARRKVLKLGRSRGITLPAGIVTADEVTMAVNRWVLLDPQGKATGAELVRILERLEVDP